MLNLALQIYKNNDYKRELTMLVTFSTRSRADITMFGDVAIQLLKLMGHSGNVPSALYVEDVPAALSSLQESINDLKENEEQDSDDHEDEDGDEDNANVSLIRRAAPLIDLLEAAVSDKANVMWEENK